MTVAAEPYLVELPRIYDPRGNLSFAQNGDGRVPFDIKRVFWIYDIPAGEERGGHAYHSCSEFLIAASGSFNVNLFDGRRWFHFTLNRPYQALVIPPGYWRTLDNFASGSVGMAMMSTTYSEDDYIRDFDDFLRSKACNE